MALHQLTVTPVDVSGSQLGLALNAPLPQSLASLELTHPNGSCLTLGVLGASHVVSVRHRESVFSEEISCQAEAAGTGLPSLAHAPGYRLESRIDMPDDTAFGALADSLRQACEERSGWIGGAFPGDEAALTALAGECDGTGWRWRTWHLYPRDRTVVYTSSWWRP